MKEYAVATEIGGSTKKDAFNKHIDPELSSVATNNAIARMEAKPDFMEIVDEVIATADAELELRKRKIENKQMDLYEKGMAKVSSHIDEVDSTDTDAVHEAVTLLDRTLTIGRKESSSAPPHQNYDSEGVFIE